jgi:hypothetical protein
LLDELHLPPVEPIRVFPVEVNRAD